MAVIPLFSSVDISPRYLTLKVERGLLVITETSKTRSLPELRVMV